MSVNLLPLVQTWKQNIAWYQPKTDTDSWKFFFQYCYNVDYTKGTADTLKMVAWNCMKLETSVDVGMWDTRKKRLSIFLDSNINVDGDDPTLLEAIQFEFVACFLNNYSEASHNNDLWKSINDSAVAVLKQPYTLDKALSINDWPSFNKWAGIAVAIPGILYTAFKTVRLSYYCPTEDTDSWNYFQHVVFRIAPLDSVQIVYNSTYLLTNVSSSVDSGMWSSLADAAKTFLNVNLGGTYNNSQSQIDLSIKFVEIFVNISYNHAAHNQDLFKLYQQSFATAKMQLINLGKGQSKEEVNGSSAEK